jgi:hypothetical protein
MELGGFAEGIFEKSSQEDGLGGYVSRIRWIRYYASTTR